MIVLSAITKSLELETGAAVSTDYTASYVDVTAVSYTAGDTEGNTAAAGTVTAVAAPAANTNRLLKALTVRNRSTTTAQTVAFKVDVSGVDYYIGPAIVLQPGESLVWGEMNGWSVYDASGRQQVVQAPAATLGGRALDLVKVGGAAEAIGATYLYAADNGSPGAWSPGAPGAAGRATNGTDAANDGGCLPWVNAPSGSWYLTGMALTASIGALFSLHDVLWVNSGLDPTVTTAQNVNSVAFPARDLNGTTNGQGVLIGIYVTTATTNAGAVSTITMSYTNQAGTAGRTATMASFPATAVAGTVVWFELQAGDTGVRSIQTITLGTTLGGGAISLIAARRVASVAVPLANVGANAPIDANSGVELFDGTCLLLAAVRSSATANNVYGNVFLTNR